MIDPDMPSTSLRFPILCLPFLLLAATHGRSALADTPTVSQCLSATEAAIQASKDNKFRAARTHLLTCVAASCPEEVRQDCSRRIDQIAASIPTVVFAAHDASGRERSDVKVTMDGEAVADHLDGRALTLDPGAHQFTFEIAGSAPFTESLILHEGDKGRREDVTLPGSSGRALAPPATTPESATTPAPSAETPANPVDNLPSRDGDPGKGLRVAGLAVGSAGLIGVAVGSLLGALTISSWGNANSECPTHVNCSTQATNNRGAAVTDGTVSTVAFIGGGALLAGGITLFVLAPKSAPASVGLTVSPGMFGLKGEF